MRDGVVTGQVEPENMIKTSVNQLANYMVGKTTAITNHAQERKVYGDICFEVEELSCKNENKVILDDISLCIRKGEILGIAGVEGNGQSELVKALTGLLKPNSMILKLDGKTVKGTTKDFIKQGIGHIPEDRLKYAVAENMSIAENLVLGYQDSEEYCKKGIMKLKKIKSMSAGRIEKYRIKAPDFKTLINQLSGGNQQKVVVARVFEETSKVLICSQLTRGVDISTSEFFYSLLRAFGESGGATLLVSSDLEEIFTLSDTIAVMYKGKIAGLRKKEDFTREEVGILMTGGRLDTGKEDHCG
jgi:simple sugar transport system ATP-binding protein